MQERDTCCFWKSLKDVPGESVLFTGLSSDRVGVHNGPLYEEKDKRGQKRETAQGKLGHAQ